MGYFEHYCQLCGVSFAIGRIRTPYEPVEAAWRYTGMTSEDDVDSTDDGLEDTCGSSSGCQNLERRMEHLAGPGCIGIWGYSGYQISVEEMKGCRAVQCLLKKSDGWEAEGDDQDFELESKYFLTGLGDGSPDMAPLDNITPARHGVEEVQITNALVGGDVMMDWGLPFHPTCFEIFTRGSRELLGRVDVHGLWKWRERDCSWDSFQYEFPRELAVKKNRGQWWAHTRGTEYLVANPIEVPGLASLLRTCFVETLFLHPYGAHTGVFRFTYKGPNDYQRQHRTPPPAPHTNDPFMKLPMELLHMIVDSVSSKDIVNLRLVTRAYRQLIVIMFRKRLMDDMPWLWEAHALPKLQTDWFKMYTMLRAGWQNLKGLRNRRRIWKDVNVVVSRIERLRREGKIVDE